MSYYLRKIEEIKKVLLKNVYPPIFDTNKWTFKQLNCYAYALDLPVSDRIAEIYCPGCICDEKAKKQVYSKEDLIERIKRDLNFLGISYREDNDNLLKGEYRIAIYYMPARGHDNPIDFHFVRQDVDGIWSEKPSWEAKVRRLNVQTNKAPDLSENGLRLEKVLILSKLY